MSTGPDAAAPQPFADERGSASAHLPPGAPPGWWRLLDRLVAATFAAVILVGAGLLAAGVRPAEVENRPLRTLPPPTIDALVDGSWARAADAFLADNLAARP